MLRQQRMHKATKRKRKKKGVHDQPAEAMSLLLSGAIFNNKHKWAPSSQSHGPRNMLVAQSPTGPTNGDPVSCVFPSQLASDCWGLVLPNETGGKEVAASKPSL